MDPYVNSSVQEGTKSSEKKSGSCHPGGSKVYMLVGVSFGLLCIIQSALNVSLRLQGTGFVNTSDHVDLLLVMDQLENKIRDLQFSNDYLAEDNEVLHELLISYKNHTTALRAEIERLNMRLSEPTPQSQSCSVGWTLHGSSCYLLSTDRKDWWYAQYDCRSRGAHLVILNDDLEKNAIHTLGKSAVWTSLTANRRRNLEMWRWHDGSPLDNADWFQPQTDDLRFLCAFSRSNRFDVKLVRASCGDEHYWVCEKEML